MAECTKHENVIKELSEIKERLSANEQTVKDGWKVIRRNEERISEVERSTERVEEKTNSIFKLLTKLTDTIESIDDKLDSYIKDVRQEIKDTNIRLNKVEKEAALNTNNITWNWKTILAAGTVITFLISVIGQIFVGAL